MKKLLIIICLVGIMFFSWQSVSAQSFKTDLNTQLKATAGSGGADFGTPQDPRNIIGYIIQVFLGMVGIAFVAYIVYAGTLLVFSQGEEEKIKKAKSIILYGVIGLLIVLSAWGIARFVIRLYEGEVAPPVGETYIRPDMNYNPDPYYTPPAFQVKY